MFGLPSCGHRIASASSLKDLRSQQGNEQAWKCKIAVQIEVLNKSCIGYVSFVNQGVLDYAVLTNIA